MRLLKIGRDPKCDIVLNSPKASALHAEITILNNGDILLEDKNSTNGTYVMNQAIRPGTQVSVRRGDKITFGDVDLQWTQIPEAEDLSGYKAVYSIGTSMRNDVQISGNTASRYHATLKIDRKDNAYLQDHSKNGTTVNGQRIGNGQSVKVKRTDAIACGGVPVNIADKIPSSPWKTILKVAACIAVICGVAYAAWMFIPGRDTVTPSTTQAIENASACVYGGYIYEIDLQDDPFKNLLGGLGWPQKWYAGSDEYGRMTVQLSPDGLSPYTYSGTAFFISENGEMGTNRHIAAPWKYITPAEEESIRDQVAKFKRYLLSDSGVLNIILNSAINTGQLSYSDAMSLLDRFLNSGIKEIGGRHEFFGVGLTGTKVNNIIDLQQAQVIAESGSDDRDVALIRLNSRKTPEYIVRMGGVYDLSKARTDERSLKPSDEEFTITGYPAGAAVGTALFQGTELRPTMHKASLSKMPDDDQMQIQAVGVGGQSGSPVMDKQHRLVGVLCSGFQGTEITFCCNIKHLVELYEKHRVRE